MSVNSKAQPGDEKSATAARWTPLGEITEPGTYVAKDTGDLIRVPPHGGSVGDEELFDKSANQTMLVAKVSHDPFIPITKARFAAAALDIEVSF